jgi:hypothetical protein
VTAVIEQKRLDFLDVLEALHPRREIGARLRAKRHGEHPTCNDGGHDS